MNKNEVSGAAQEIKGKVEKEAGKVAGNERAQAHGEAEEMKGKAKKDLGRVEGKANDAVQDAKSKIHNATK